MGSFLNLKQMLCFFKTSHEPNSSVIKLIKISDTPLEFFFRHVKFISLGNNAFKNCIMKDTDLKKDKQSYTRHKHYTE